MGRGHLPYRGDGFPTNFKAHRRYINLKKLKWTLAKTIATIIAILAALTFIILQVSSNSYNNDKTYIVVLVIIWLIALMVITGILDLNKFRKGYDIDISSRAETDDDNKPNESDKKPDQ